MALIGCPECAKRIPIRLRPVLTAACPLRPARRCLVYRRNGQWLAFCLDFDLAVQGQTLDEVKGTLSLQVQEYVFDALAGEDRAHAGQLLTRRAPWFMWARYYWYRIFARRSARLWIWTDT